MVRTEFVMAFFVVGLALTTVSPATAKIHCQGPNQINASYGTLRTPYCEDEYLAHVARGYGMRVSGAAIRQNINRKVEVCRLVGNDIRVQSICGAVSPDGRRGRRWP